jgi:hypothetical protein
MDPKERYSMGEIFGHTWMEGYYKFFKIDVSKYIKEHDIVRRKAKSSIGQEEQRNKVMTVEQGVMSQNKKITEGYKSGKFRLDRDGGEFLADDRNEHCEEE